MLCCLGLEIFNDAMFEPVRSERTMEHARGQSSCSRCPCARVRAGAHKHMAAGSTQQLAWPPGEHVHTRDCPEDLEQRGQPCLGPAPRLVDGGGSSSSRCSGGVSRGNSGRGEGFRGHHGDHGGRWAYSFLPGAWPCGICTNAHSLIWAPGHSCIQLVSKLLQNKGIHIDAAIKQIRDLLKLFKELRISGFENGCRVASQISMGLEIGIKCKDCSIWQNTTFIQNSR